MNLAFRDNKRYFITSGGKYLTTPDAADISITGDIDLRVQAWMSDWTPTDAQGLVEKNSTASNRSYAFTLTGTGVLQLRWSANGTLMSDASSTVANSLANGTVGWIRATLDVDNGAAGNEVKFYQSTDGQTWTQIGTTVTAVGTTSIFDGTSPLTWGLSETATMPGGRLYYGEVRNGIGGTVVAKFNAKRLRPRAVAYYDGAHKFTVTS